MFGSLFGKKASPKEKVIRAWSEANLGYRPKDMKLFTKALTHSSAVREANKEAFIHQSNERLEFLGDAVLASVVAERLYDSYPDKGEGFLTRFRARLVQRDTLNKLGEELKMGDVVAMRVEDRKTSSVLGNAFEAVIGAIYMEKGYEAARRVVVNSFNKHVDIERMSKVDNDKKSRLLEWGQKNKRKVTFKLEEEKSEKNKRSFRAEVFVDGKLKGFGNGRSKKSAEQEAAKFALRKVARKRRRKKSPTV